MNEEEQLKLGNEQVGRIRLTKEDTGSGEIASSELRGIVDSASKHRSVHNPKSNEVILIGLWPHGNTSTEVVEAGTKIDKSQADDNVTNSKTSIESVVGLFATIWLAVMFWKVLESSTFSVVLNLQSFLPLLVLPVFTMMRGTTHVRFSASGIEALSLTAASEKVRKTLYWSRIDRVYLDGQDHPTALDQSLVFNSKDGQVLKIKLKKIANRSQWMKVLTALDNWCDLSIEGIDREIFDAVSQDRSSPTYTMLWLEALAAPPRRERLTPLTEGTPLCKGRYVLNRKLGAGGQGSAFLATSTTDGSRVVLKEYILPIYVDLKARKQALERFENEAKMLSKLNHPSIVKLEDYFVDDHRAYLVLEYIDGDNLQQIVEKSGPLSDSVAFDYTNALVDILDYLHCQSPPVVHRDFTPDNLIASKDGRIKLIDFMVAQQSELNLQQSASSTVVGKHAYMAPEQFRGQNRTQSDIYALGCTLYFLLTGKEPEPITQLYPILANENCPLILNEIVSKCTEADYLDRYQHVGEIKTQLARAFQANL